MTFSYYVTCTEPWNMKINTSSLRRFSPVGVGKKPQGEQSRVMSWTTPTLINLKTLDPFPFFSLQILNSSCSPSHQIRWSGNFVSTMDVISFVGYVITGKFWGEDIAFLIKIYDVEEFSRVVFIKKQNKIAKDINSFFGSKKKLTCIVSFQISAIPFCRRWTSSIWWT